MKRLLGAEEAEDEEGEAAVEVPALDGDAEEVPPDRHERRVVEVRRAHRARPRHPCRGGGGGGLGMPIRAGEGSPSFSATAAGYGQCLPCVFTARSVVHLSLPPSPKVGGNIGAPVWLDLVPLRLGRDGGRGHVCEQLP